MWHGFTRFTHFHPNLNFVYICLLQLCKRFMIQCILKWKTRKQLSLEDFIMHLDFNKPFSLLKGDVLFVSKIKEQYKFIQYTPGGGRSRHAALSEVWPTHLGLQYILLKDAKLATSTQGKKNLFLHKTHSCPINTKKPTPKSTTVHSDRT